MRNSFTVNKCTTSYSSFINTPENRISDNKRNIFFICVYLRTSAAAFICKVLPKHILFFTTLSLGFTLLMSEPLFSENARPHTSKGSVVIFAMPQGNPQMSALNNSAVRYLHKIFHTLGRFRPVESNRTNWAIKAVHNNPEKSKNIFESVSKALDAEFYVVVSFFHTGNTILGNMDIIPLEKNSPLPRRRILVRSRIMTNIPLKLGRELAYLHKKIPVTAKILKELGNNRYYINAGTWNNIRRGESYSTDNYHISVSEPGRYDAIVRISGRKFKAGETISMNVFPGVSKVVDDLNDSIDRNTRFKYGLENTLLKGDDPGKRMIQGICVINLGGNLCVPGYGAYLSTHYLGFKETSAETAGVALSTTVILLQLSLPSLATGFSVNFFPWEKDSSKTEKMQRLHYFLWGSLPITFSVAYMDQLSYLFNKTKHLPPFFSTKDMAASTFSLLIPGGGLFYKGHRIAGWGYYLTEMSLAGYGFYHLKTGKRGLYAFSILGAVKLVELFHAFFIRPSYKFYRIEMDREKQRVSLSVNTLRFDNLETVYTVGLTCRH